MIQINMACLICISIQNLKYLTFEVMMFWNSSNLCVALDANEVGDVQCDLTRRNLGICNHLICDYMWLCVVCDYFCNSLPTSLNLGRICDYTMTNVQLLFFSSPYVNAFRLYSFKNKPSCPISCISNEKLVTNYVQCVLWAW